MIDTLESQASKEAVDAVVQLAQRSPGVEAKVYVFQGRGETEHDTSSYLVHDGRRIYRVTAVHSAHHAMNLDLSLVHRDFRNLCFEAADVG